MFRIRADHSWPLHDIRASRELERLSSHKLPDHALMQRAGLAVAKLARAIAPHGRRVWIACGPGNNGGDGFEAALHLHRQGWQVTLTWIQASHEPADARTSRERALAAGLKIEAEPPQNFDLAIDALLGLGGELSSERPASSVMARWLEQMHASHTPTLAVDLPTGLNADTGAGFTPAARTSPRHTLSLLSLKPGLFTGQGRDLAGAVWYDSLDVDTLVTPPTGRLIGADEAAWPRKVGALHASHKGSFGDVVVVGGQQTQGNATSMAGAALLAARAALYSGAGRVYVTLLGKPDLRVDLGQPELMFRPAAAMGKLGAQQVVVAGCGGGSEIGPALPALLAQSVPMVLDADALNAVSADPALREVLAKRGRAGPGMVLTPHPLEAARLLDCPAAQVQANRLQAAKALAEEFSCVVALKGSGTVVAAPGRPLGINPTGNALLATAGTGDVLAGMLGAGLARGLSAWAATVAAVHEHGRRADEWQSGHSERPLTASDLARWNTA